MTTGALIFAFNNEQTDYVHMAAWSADRIRRHLGIPVAVVTDATSPQDLKSFDKVIAARPVSGGSRWFDDYGRTVTWFNAARINAYAVTPWQQTLVLDADYVVASGVLREVLIAQPDFACFRTAISASTAEELDGLNWFGRYRMPMWWATVMTFTKNHTAQYVFDCMQMIHDNWSHYRDLYGIDRETYRNDYALSIALGIVSGHTGRCTEIPWPLVTAMPDTALTMLDSDSWQFTFENQQGQTRQVMMTGMDFHAMGKHHLETAIATT